MNVNGEEELKIYKCLFNSDRPTITIRGGSFHNIARSGCSAARAQYYFDDCESYIGFRCVKDII